MKSFQRYSKEAFENETLTNHTVYYHHVGQSQDKDVPIYTHQNADWRTTTTISHDGRYLLLKCMYGSKNNALLIADLTTVGEINGKIQFKTIVKDLHAVYQVLK